MKYIVSTLIAAFIAFVIWTFYANEVPKDAMMEKYRVTDGIYPAFLLEDNINPTDECQASSDAKCKVYVKVYNGYIAEVDSANRKPLWTNKLKPAPFKGGLARIKTAEGKVYKLVIDCETNHYESGSNSYD